VGYENASETFLFEHFDPASRRIPYKMQNTFMAAISFEALFYDRESAAFNF